MNCYITFVELQTTDKNISSFWKMCENELEKTAFLFINITVQQIHCDQTALLNKTG